MMIESVTDNVLAFVCGGTTRASCLQSFFKALDKTFSQPIQRGVVVPVTATEISKATQTDLYIAVCQTMIAYDSIREPQTLQNQVKWTDSTR